MRIFFRDGIVPEKALELLKHSFPAVLHFVKHTILVGLI
ncbi:hypothetical protein LEP1GSC062_3115 [Leptospira alexanderi serovar Manhao 3 str. L 60]|uniref:Uncharacterized protein n=1 Tax=Leptospira alexanderi serovar Manhao 3 str. L 60 TaxID=1049759 RepID=V6HVM8_9LEPT|nr:hypothetical protein LEP1GSC062_3115 [Leptospira alexanderi serovar Manhao 3 str. L 60]